MILLSPTAAIMYATRAACVAFGAEDTAALRVTWRRLQSSVQPLLAQASRESRVLETWLDDAAKGLHIHCEIHALDGPEAGGVAIIRSAQRAANMERLLELAVDQEILRALAPAASHTYRDSLNSLSVNTELLARTLPTVTGRDDTAVQQRCLAALHREIDRIERISRQIIDEARPTITHGTRVTVSGIVHSVLTLVAQAAAAQRVTIRSDDHGAAAEVAGRVSELRQALLCLTINALEAMPAGGELRIATHVDGSTVVITVFDSGPGVPVEIQPFIWELFFSTKERGHGLGLAVARRIASAYGGTVTLDQAAPGAAFSIRLPVAA